MNALDSNAIEARALDALMPMHLRIGSDGCIRHAGPTLAKLCTGRPLVGMAALDLLEFQRPRKAPAAPGDLADLVGKRLAVALRGVSDVAMKGHIVPFPGGEWLMNLAFGLSIGDAVRAFGLTNSDFAATDLAVEMLYMFEAKELVMRESDSLNQRLQTARKRAEDRAFTDPLTGLKNRRAMDQRLARLTRAGIHFGLMHVDLDFFKAVNDSLGHAAGDHVLCHAARILREQSRAEDLVARVGGDEFVLALVGVTSGPELMRIAQRIVERLERPISFQGRDCQISCSVGISVSEHYSDPEPDRMLADADAALYASKREGRGRATMSGPQTGSN